MLINEHVAVRSGDIVLVPYSAHHVPRYHEWMKDAEIQAATASEPLTIDEEYDMQRSWRQDGDKLTFIVGVTNADGVGAAVIGGGGYNMVGDVNLFITTDYDDAIGKDVLVGELELMVAEKSMQCKGLGRKSLVAFLEYIVANGAKILEEYHTSNTPQDPILALDYFRVKIGKDNARSLKLFQGLGFAQVGEVSYFAEIELRRTINASDVAAMRAQFDLPGIQQVRYEDRE